MTTTVSSASRSILNWAGCAEREFSTTRQWTEQMPEWAQPVWMPKEPFHGGTRG